MAPASDALPILFREFRARGDGARILTLGDSGSGKSVTLQWVVDSAIAEPRFCDYALVLDDKDRDAHFAGDQRINLADADANPPTGRVVVFRGDVQADVRCTAEELAARTKENLQKHGDRVLLVYDELARATNAEDDGDGKRFTAPSAKWMFVEGRQLGGSIFAGTQSPQEVPRSAINNSCRLLHRMGDNAANYCRDSWFLPRHMVDALCDLADGQFILLQSGRTTWDGRVYQVPPPGSYGG